MNQSSYRIYIHHPVTAIFKSRSCYRILHTKVYQNDFLPRCFSSMNVQPFHLQIPSILEPKFIAKILYNFIQFTDIFNGQYYLFLSIRVYLNGTELRYLFSNRKGCNMNPYIRGFSLSMLLSFSILLLMRLLSAWPLHQLGTISQ